MPANVFRILVLGDIIGRPGMRSAVSALRGLQRTHQADFTVVNAENADDGYGVNRELAGQLFKAGADVLTSGNHIWHDDHVGDLLSAEPRVLRPENYPKGVPGTGIFQISVRGVSVLVVNLQGRDRMPMLDCPFRRAREVLKQHKATTQIRIIDFHAEATDEKEAMGYHLDGDVTVVYGTHTHVATADERILPRGTAYITDIGACLPVPSVIGFDPAISIRRSITQLPLRNEVAEARAVIHGIVVEADVRNGQALKIERFTHESVV